MSNDMEKFIGENGKVFIAISHELSEEEALKIANRHFKVKRTTFVAKMGIQMENICILSRQREHLLCGR